MARFPISAPTWFTEASWLCSVTRPDAVLYGGEFTNGVTLDCSNGVVVGKSYVTTGQ
jgi:hypothetical protein